jgi:hypothetical protein
MYYKVEIRVDTRIPTRIQVKYNKPDIFILDKVKKEIIIVEVGITSFDNLIKQRRHISTTTWQTTAQRSMEQLKQK